ncbi:MORN repeat-containing protein 3-like [Tachypleus tridentatus]|uniref:MORN repeat-containing protein 3-like n=1 Tax=Tachypleus tridentatus TaxID=6853 RepID=UPI003FD1FCD0
MPRFKTQQKKSQPIWKQNLQKAKRNGVLHTIYDVNGNWYSGEWAVDKKHGKGTQFWKATGATYSGDWKNGKRHGHGTFGVPNPSGSGLKEQYVGDWSHNEREGHGIQLYENGERYDGEWHRGRRHGWGRMLYFDASVYEGEWEDDARNGLGLLRFANGNRHEGCWRDDKRNGSGTYFFVDTAQIMQGLWVDDIFRCGTIKNVARENAPKPTALPIPEVTLANPDDVLHNARLAALSNYSDAKLLL